MDRAYTLLLSLRLVVHRVHEAMQQLHLLLSLPRQRTHRRWLPVPVLQRLGGAARGLAASWGREELKDGLKVAA